MKPLPDLLVRGMHGLGDNLHQRGIVRQLMRQRTLWLETPWPCLYHDLVGERLGLVNVGSRLRTQAKNVARESESYHGEPPADAEVLKVSYTPAAVRAHGSVYAAMCSQVGTDPAESFQLPIPEAWNRAAQEWIDRWRPTRPLLIFRPLVERSEWGGCRNRNPEAVIYRALLDAVRDRFFVVSVADLEPEKEWLAGPPVLADAVLHAGELNVEVLAALMARAGLVFSSPGFAVVMAQAVGAPSVCVFGGYENGSSFSAGARFAAHLVIEPMRPCCCFSHTHACRKEIDFPKALARLRAFVDDPSRRTSIAV